MTQIPLQPQKGLFLLSLKGVKVTSVFVLLRSVAELVGQILLVRLLEPQVFGQMAFLLATINLVDVFTNLQVERFYLKEKQDELAKFGTLFSAELILALFWTLSLVLLGPLFFRQIGRSNLIGPLQLLAFYILAKKAMSLKVLFEKKLDFVRSQFISVTGIGLGVLLSVLLAQAGLGLYALIFGQLAGVFLGALIAIALSYRVTLVDPISIDKNFLKQGLMFGLPLTLAAVLSTYYWNVDNYLVELLAGSAALGFYWFAFKFPHYLLFFLQSFSSVVFASFARTTSNEQLYSGFSLVTRYAATFLGLPLILVLIFGRDLVLVFFGQQWLPALLPLQIFTALAFLRGTFGYWSDVLTLRGYTRFQFKVMLLNAALISLLGYYFTKFWGATGMALAVSVSILVSFLPMGYKTKQVLPLISYFDLLKKPLLAILFVLVTSRILIDWVLIGFMPFLPIGFWALSFKILIITVVYLITVYLVEPAYWQELKFVVRHLRG